MVRKIELFQRGILEKKRWVVAVSNTRGRFSGEKTNQMNKNNKFATKKEALKRLNFLKKKFPSAKIFILD